MFKTQVEPRAIGEWFHRKFWTFYGVISICGRFVFYNNIIFLRKTMLRHFHDLYKVPFLCLLFVSGTFLGFWFFPSFDHPRHFNFGGPRLGRWIIISLAVHCTVRHPVLSLQWRLDSIARPLFWSLDSTPAMTPWYKTSRPRLLFLCLPSN